MHTDGERLGNLLSACVQTHTEQRFHRNRKVVFLFNGDRGRTVRFESLTVVWMQGSVNLGMHASSQLEKQTCDNNASETTLPCKQLSQSENPMILKTAISLLLNQLMCTLSKVLETHRCMEETVLPARVSTDGGGAQWAEGLRKGSTVNRWLQNRVQGGKGGPFLPEKERRGGGATAQALHGTSWRVSVGNRESRENTATRPVRWGLQDLGALGGTRSRWSILRSTGSDSAPAGSSLPVTGHSSLSELAGWCPK